MRIIISILIITAIIIAVCTLPARFRKRIQRFIDHAISQSVFRQLSFLIIATGLAFGSLLLLICIRHGNLKLHLLDWIYTYINPGSFFNSEGKEASDRAWAIILGVVGMIFMNGLLISVISNIIERRVDKVKNGKVHYHFSKHIVIIGYDRMCNGLIRRFAKDERYRNCEIVLQTTQEAPKVRHELFSGLDTKIEKKITIISGSRVSTEDLERLQIDRCMEVFVLGENDEYDNDSLDLECLKKMHAILSEKSDGRIIRCNVLFECQSTFALFQRQDIDRLKDRIDFIPFNYYEMWAQKMFVDGTYENSENGGLRIDYTPLDREGIHANSDKKVHLVVIGMSDMGVALGTQAAHLCHFPNFVTKGIKTRITFIDENADVEMNYMRGRYLHLFDEADVYYREVSRSNMMNGSVMKDEAVRINTKETFTDIEFEFIRARSEYPAIQEYIAGLSGNRNLCLTIAVCFTFPPKAVASGLYLPDEVYDNDIPVLVRQEIPYCALDMLTKEGKFRNIKPFGMLGNCYDLAKADDRIPMMVNYVYSKGIPEMFPEEEMVTMWRGLRTAHKWSNRYNADSIKFKMRSFPNLVSGEKLSDGQIELMAKVEHNRWNIEKLLMGYRPTTPLEKAAIAKDLSLKNKLKTDSFAHNDICHYDDLQTDESETDTREYDRRISAALPLMIRTDKRLQAMPRKCGNSSVSV